MLKLKKLATEYAIYALNEWVKVMYIITILDRDFELIVSTISIKIQNQVVSVSYATSLLLGHKI